MLYYIFTVVSECPSPASYFVLLSIPRLPPTHAFKCNSELSFLVSKRGERHLSDSANENISASELNKHVS